MTGGGKYKGANDQTRRMGMGRLRHAAEKDVNRGPGWERHVEDDHFLEQHGERSQLHGGRVAGHDLVHCPGGVLGGQGFSAHQRSQHRRPAVGHLSVSG